MTNLKIELSKKDIDIILFSETWLNDTDEDGLYTFPKYNLFRQDRISIYRGGGLCAHVDETLACSVDKFKMLNRCTPDIEVQWLLSIKGNEKKSLVCNVYRPPNGSLQGFCDTFRALLLQIDDLSVYDVYILGDFNVNCLLASNEKRVLYELMDQFNLIQLVNEITTSSGTNTCIDLIFTNCNDIISSGPLNIHLSDHLPIHLIKKQVVSKPTYRLFKGRSYRNFNMNDYLLSVENCNWVYFDQCEDAAECWDVYVNILKRMLDVPCPVREFKVRDKPDPWMTNFLIERLTDKNNLLREARNSASVLTWFRARMLRNTVNEEIDVARNKYYSGLSDAFIKDSRKFWATLKEILPSGKSGSKFINLINGLGETILPENTAEFINSFFANIGPELAQQHQLPWEFRGERCEEDMPDVNFTDEQIIKCVQDIDTSKSSAIEYLPTHIFKRAVLHNPSRFIKIINLCVETCAIPGSWKIATVTPLPKGGDATSVSNLRPISVLPVPGKVLERLIHTAISSHLENNNILSKNQGGYQKQKSTLDSISNLVDNILENRNKGNITKLLIESKVDFCFWYPP